MYCNQCGKQLPDNAVFCKFCGARVTNEEKTQPEIVPSAPAMAQNEKKPFPWWILSIPAALILAGAVLLFVKLDQQNTTVSEQVSETVTEPEQVSEWEEESVEPAAEEETVIAEEADSDAEAENVVEAVPEQPEPIVYTERKVPFRRADATSYCTSPSKDGQTYEPFRAIDGSLTTAWLEGKDGLGIGESLTIEFDKAERITKLVVYNGFLNTKYRYAINGKVTKLLVEFNDGTAQTADLKVMEVPEDKVPFGNDEMNPTEIIFDHPVNASMMKLTIRDAVAGTKYDDVCISEVELFREVPDNGEEAETGVADEEILSAYEAYFASEFAPTPYGDYSVAFAYIDEDDIPEMVVEENFDMGDNHILQYADGIVYSTGILGGGFTFEPQKNIIWWGETDGETFYESYYRIAGHELVTDNPGISDHSGFTGVPSYYHTVREAYQNIGR